MTHVELANETIQYYSADSSRRGMIGEVCSYFGENNTKCAVGRLLDEDVIKSKGFSLDELFGDVKDLFNILKRNDDKFQKFLLAPYQNININFLEDLQNFHDNKRNWDSTTITDQGKIRIALLLQKAKHYDSNSID